MLHSPKVRSGTPVPTSRIRSCPAVGESVIGQELITTSFGSSDLLSGGARPAVVEPGTDVVKNGPGL